MAYTTFAPIPGQLGRESGPVRMQEPVPCSVSVAGGPFTVTPVRPMFVVNGNGVTLVTGSRAAGSRPQHGQQWARGSQWVLSQYANAGQR